MKKLFRKYGYRIENYNYRLILYVVILSIIGVLVVHSATINETPTGIFDTTQKQIIGILLGAVIMFVISLVDYKMFLKYWIVIYILNLLILVYVRFFGVNVSGARRWISIPGFGTIQPSEFTKVAMILIGTAFLCKVRDRINNVFILIAYLVLIAPPVFFVLQQPDLSTTIVIMVALVVLVYLAGIDSKWVWGVTGIIGVCVVILLVAVYQPEQTLLNSLLDNGILKNHQLNRINAYFFPNEHRDLVYQQLTSVTAIGSGKFIGKGLNTSTYESVKNGNFLSEEQCDFIFAVAGEELGFIGCIVIIVLVGLIVYECLKMAKKANRLSGLMIGCSIAALLAIQSFVNIGVATLIIPNTGIPLPFVSAGLSSLLSSYIMIGLVLNIGLQPGKIELK